MNRIDHLVTAAPEFGAVLTMQTQHEAHVVLPVLLVDGLVREHHLYVNMVDGCLRVAEHRDRRLLPAFCAERHINGDGSFCLGWEDTLDRAPPSYSWAIEWWQRLAAFLRAQVRAEKSRRWPGPAWPHGGAAVYQRRAEIAAAALSPAISKALERGELAVHSLDRQTLMGETVFILKQNSRVIWRFGGMPLRIINKQLACACPRGDIKRHRRLRTCGSHAQDLLDLANALINRDHEQQRFWIQLRGQSCCGTMDGCDLRFAEDFGPDNHEKSNRKS
jgi:hypothetical protein